MKFPIQQDLDMQAFADEFGDDVDLSGPLVDLSGAEPEAAVPEKEAETSTEIPDTDESEQEAAESAHEQVEETAGAPEAFQFEYNGKPYEVTVDQIVELNNGYLRQEDYTRKLQWFGNWYQQHQSQVNFVNNLDKLFELRPDKAKVFYEQIINDVSPAQTQAVQQPEKTVQELLNEQQQAPQVSQQAEQQVSPEMVQLYNLALYQQEQLKQQQAAWEDLQLDTRLNAAKQKYGDFDENSVLQWMLYLRTEDPEVAINRMIAEAWKQQGATTGQRPASVSQSVVQSRQTPVAPYVESGKRGRGVAASAKKQAGPPQVYNSYTDAAQQILQAGIF